MFSCLHHLDAESGDKVADAVGKRLGEGVVEESHFGSCADLDGTHHAACRDSLGIRWEGCGVVDVHHAHGGAANLDFVLLFHCISYL